MRALLLLAILAAAPAAAGAGPDELREHPGLVFDADGPRTLDLLLPGSGEDRPAAPVLLWLVGTGATAPVREAELALARQLATRGLAVARLDCGSNFAPERGAGLARRALLWLGEQRERFGLAPERWAVMGSGPATWAAARAALPAPGPASGDAASRGNPPPRALILLGGTPGSGAPALPAQLDPAGLPPVLFLVGEHDRPLRDANSRRRLRAAGLPCAVRVLATAEANFWRHADCRHALADEIERCLHPRLELPEEEWSVALPTTAAGPLTMRPNAIECRIADATQRAKVEIPRFHNRMLRAEARHAGGTTELSLQPGLQTWSLPIPEALRTPGPLTVRLDTAERPALAAATLVVSAAAEGHFLLPAHQATAHGRLLRYEPQPHKNTVGYWADAADWCEWKLLVDEPGRFELHVLQGCGKGQGGSRVRFELAEQSLPFTVVETGHFQNFQRHPVGTLEIDRPGVHTLRLRAQHKAAGAVMDVREVTLSPTR